MINWRAEAGSLLVWVKTRKSQKEQMLSALLESGPLGLLSMRNEYNALASFFVTNDTVSTRHGRALSRASASRLLAARSNTWMTAT